jgi:transcriptional regulator CtsR
MPRLSDLIEKFIKEMLSDNDSDELEIKRNELANYFSCAPSQINYVLTTRFTTEKGYYVESKRGGGGCIRIKRVVFDENEYLANIINKKIGGSITYDSGAKIVNSLIESNIITEREANIIKMAINDRTLSSCFEYRNKVRADILKSAIMVVLM